MLYITECPYCGNRLRKRAPKLDRQGRVSERPSRRPPTPSLGRLRRGEIPGIRHDAPPYATILLVLMGLAGCLVWRAHPALFPDLVVAGSVGHQWWKLLIAPFVYVNTGYAFAALGVTAVFGTLLEHRHGPFLVVALFLAGAVGGTLLTSLASPDLVLGGNGGGLALLVAWTVPHLMARQAARDTDADLIGVGVLAVVLALMPIIGADASWISDGVGLLVGLLIGTVLAQFAPVD